MRDKVKNLELVKLKAWTASLRRQSLGDVREQAFGELRENPQGAYEGVQKSLPRQHETVVGHKSGEV